MTKKEKFEEARKEYRQELDALAQKWGKTCHEYGAGFTGRMWKCPVKQLTGKYQCDKCPMNDGSYKFNRSACHSKYGGSFINLDHIERKSRKGEFVYYPYYLEAKHMLNLVNICKTFGFRLSVSGGHLYHYDALRVAVHNDAKTDVPASTNQTGVLHGEVTVKIPLNNRDVVKKFADRTSALSWIMDGLTGCELAVLDHYVSLLRQLRSGCTELYYGI